MTKRVVSAATSRAYKKVVKPAVFKLHPDKVHHGMVTSARLVGRARPLLAPLRRGLAYQNDKVLGQTLFGQQFANPIGISAGLDKNGEMPAVAQTIGCGFTTVGSLTIAPRQGNDHPWFYRLPQTKSLVVHVGMANIGLGRIAPRLKRRPRGLPVVVSVAVVARDNSCDESAMIKDVLAALTKIQTEKLAEAVEINISCPNVQDDEPFTYGPALERLLAQVDKLKLTLPTFIKMPNLTDWSRYQEMLDVILKHRVQAVVVANLVKERDQVHTNDNLTSATKGSISGEPARQRSLKLIGQTYDYCGDRLKIIGVGGTFTAQDAYDKIRAGASLVGLITGLIFEGPAVVGQINAGLADLLARDGYQNIAQAVGVDRKTDRG